MNAFIVVGKFHGEENSNSWNVKFSLDKHVAQLEADRLNNLLAFYLETCIVDTGRQSQADYMALEYSMQQHDPRFFTNRYATVEYVVEGIQGI